VNGGAEMRAGPKCEEEESRVPGRRRARRHNVLAVNRGDKILIAVSKCMTYHYSEGE